MVGKHKRKATAGADAARKKPARIAMEMLQPAAPVTDLFKLPRALHNKVYDELWKEGTYTKQRYAQQECDVTYGWFEDGEWPESPSKHPWLLTKQVLHDGLQQLHAHSVWHMFDYEEHKKQPFNYIFPLLTPSCVRTVRIHFDAMRTSLALNFPTARSMVEKACVDAQESEVRETHVTLYCDAGPFGPARSPRNFRLDLSSLERLSVLPKLERFVFKVEGWRWARRSREEWFSPHQTLGTRHAKYKPLYEELDRLGKLLVPAGGDLVAEVNKVKSCANPKLHYLQSIFYTEKP